MRLIAMLSFFDEEPELLHECISRLKKIGVDLLVAVDGPYDLLPVDFQCSSFETINTIIGEAGADLDLILRNKASWSGNEVEKRNYMLSVALEAAQEGDWLLVVDSDHMWEQIDPNDDLHGILAGYGYDACSVAIADCALDDPSPSWYEARMLLRSVPGMHYEGSHWRVRFPDGRGVSTLKAGDDLVGEMGEISDMTSLFRVRHVVYEQPPERRKRQTIYYEERDRDGVET